MKRLFTFLMALMLTWIGANALTVVHECEAEFSDWSIAGNSSGSFQLNTWSGEADASGMTTPFIEYWVGTGSILPDATISHTQLTGLADGYYEVSIFARAFNEGSTETVVSEGITFTANDASVDLTEGTAGEFNNASEEDYGVYELLVYVDNGTLNIGFTIEGLTACDWLAFKNLEVTYLGETPVGYVAHECEAYGDDWGKPAHWTADNDATTNLHVNKHSTEADPSGMVTPFVEYWYASGTSLPDDVLRHDQLTGLYPGYYEVSIEVRAFNESGTTAINEGVTTFNAVSGDNSASADITTLTSTTAFNNHYELYGTLSLMAEVGEDGTLDIDFTVKNANYNWLSFKNLKVVYDGDAMPNLEYVTGDMNATVEATMKAAVDQYNETKNADDYTAAMNAIAAAEESVAQYAEIAALVAALDTDGAAVWANTTSGQAYTAKTLSTSDDITDDMVAAQKAQTTASSDWSYVLKNTGTWMKDNECNGANFGVDGTYQTAHEAWRGSDFDASETHPRKPIYKMIEDLPAGQYTISFYAYAAQGTATSGTIYAFANEATTTVTFDEAGTGPNWNNNGGPYTLTCNVNVEGTLRFGMESTGKGAWYVMEEGSLTLVSLAAEATDTDSEYKEGDAVTVDGTMYSIKSDNMVENHSFELGFEGWTDASTDAVTGHSTITSEYFELRSGSSNDAQDGNVYLVGATNSGSSSAGSICKVWEMEAGKTYYLSYYVKGLTDATSGTYLMTAVTNEIGNDYDIDNSKDADNAHLLHNFSGETIGTDWQKAEIVFTNGEESSEDYYTYLQVHFRWLDGQWAFDNFQIYEVEEVTEETIEWEMTSAGWGTLILPFAADVPEGLTAYSCSGLEDDDVTLSLTEATTLESCTPYIVKGTAATYSFNGTPANDTNSYQVGMLVGTLVDLSLADGTLSNDGTEYVLQDHVDENGEGEGLAFYPITSESEDVTLDAYHCYLTISSGVSPTALHLPGMATAIEAVESDLIANDAIYDLSGRRVSKAVKGVYIQNGKKVLVK